MIHVSTIGHRAFSVGHGKALKSQQLISYINTSERNKLNIFIKLSKSKKYDVILKI